MKIEERRKVAKDLYKDLEDFNGILVKRPEICKVLATWLTGFVNEYDDKIRGILDSAIHGNNLKEFVEALVIENIIFLNETTYILYAKCWSFDFGSSVQLTLKDNWLGFSCLGYESGVELKGLKVVALRGKLNSYAINSVEEIDTLPEDELEGYMEW